ncbi:GHKL domain-containing protein [Clostridium sp. D2Q-11]|uniref:GHKL domain-containing protein n=1 Tax=Anaeromonas frigoriresistens TaxID=2683708 RepID=A0A942UXW2_9FIRM|nr:ATP-binding protein [Anaeromonas frigoriresistens]MBS4540135.1 GHKL domain-containing protein [Anaeromonas frigoriresistens]
MQSYILINEIIMSFLEGFILLYLFLFISNKRDLFMDKKIINFLFIITYTIFSYWTTLSLPPGYHTVVIILFLILSLSFITNTRYPLTIATIIFILLGMMIIEMISLQLLSLMIKESTQTILTNPIHKIAFSIFVKFNEIIIITMLSKIESPIIKSFHKEFKYSLINYWFFGIFLMGGLILSIRYIIYQPEKIIIYEILISIIFALYIMIGYLDYKEKIKLISIQKKYEVQDDYIKNLETLINIVRREKHDFSNHINTIYAMCTINKPNTVERIKEYLSKISENLKNSYHIYNSGNDYIDGLLAIKSNFAYENNIIFDVNFEISIDKLSINDTDLISIISNILDNSFEAILFSDSIIESPIVSFWTYLENDKYIISITNNGPKISESNLKKIFKNGYSTKVKEKDDHGLGLYIVKNITENNNGIIKVHSNDLETEFQLIFEYLEVKNEIDKKSISISN